DVSGVPEKDTGVLIHGADKRAIGVAQKALVVPYHGLLLHRAPLHDVVHPKNDAFSADAGADITATKEEPVGGISGGGGGSGGAVELAGGGVGGKRREEAVEIGLVGAVGCEGCFV
ncbi:hypothetical protein PanWU01x14_356750, partial [Parasponia andersonii]